MCNIVAFVERESSDPITGNVGVLRKEWRVAKITPEMNEDLAKAFGRDYYRYRPYATHVLEYRCIRRGVIEPWYMLEMANSLRHALEYVDDNATSLCADLTKLQIARKVAEEKKREREKAEAEAKRAAEELANRKKKSEEAWKKLWDHPKDNIWAMKWSEFVKQHMNDTEYKKACQANIKFMELYNKALHSPTMASKRSAIKKLLAYVETKEFKRLQLQDRLKDIDHDPGDYPDPPEDR